MQESPSTKPSPPSRSRRLVLALGLILLGLTAGLLALQLLRPEAPPHAAATTAPRTPTSLAELAGGDDGPRYPALLELRDEPPGEPGEPASQRLGTAESCGGSGCHAALVEQWESSAHRWSGIDNPWYRTVLEAARQDLGTPPTRWCGGCHSPLTVLDGVHDQPLEELAAAPSEGVSCLVCHGMVEAHPLGQGDFTLAVGGRLHELATSTNPWARRLHALWVKLDPEAHRRTYRRAPLATMETGAALGASLACAACHRAMITPEVGGYRDVEIFDDHLPWQGSDFSGQSVPRPPRSEEVADCAGCHMPIVEVDDGGSPDGRAPSHRFPGAHTALAAFNDDQEQLAAVSEFLQEGGATVDIFAITGATPLAEPLPERTPFDAEPFYAPLDQPVTIRAGESRRVDVLVEPRGVGHLFPGGKSELADTWLELRVVDASGRTIFWNGRPREDRATPRAARFGTVRIDAESQRIDDYRIWNARALVYLERPAPNAPQIVRFRLDVPADAVGPLSLEARWLYRTFRPEFHRAAFADETAPPLPLVVLAEDEAILEVAAPGAPAVESAADLALPPLPESEDERRREALRFYAYGLARAAQQDHATCREIIFPRVLALLPDYAPALVQQALAVPGMEPTREWLEKARASDPELPSTNLYWVGFSLAASETDAALEALAPLAASYPLDREVLTNLGNAHLARQEFELAKGYFERHLEIDPVDAQSLLRLSQVHRSLGESEAADRYQALFEQYRSDRSASRMGSEYAAANPEVQASWSQLYEHLSEPLEGLDEGMP